MKNSTSPGVRFTTIKLTLAFSTRTLLCLTFAARIAWPALADDFRRGPLVDISDPDALAAVGSNGAAYENSIALNPANPKNIVAAWINGFGDVGCQSIVAGVSLDGGTHWQRVVIPGLTQCAGGGGFDFATDPWLSFARNGDLYLVSVNASCIPPDTCDQQHSRIAVSKSTDGGLHWWEPIVLDEGMGPGSPTDKASVTADPADARLVYATWERDFSDRIVSLFSRSTDGGQTWEPARQIYDPGVNNLVVDHQIIVLPDGTLVDYFNEFRFNETDGSYAATLSSLRSVDHGQTWSSLRRGPESASVDILDPETGHPVLSLGSFPQFVGVAVDRHNGNLYAVWEDPTFSGGQFSSVAFSMSSDGGLSWSEPIPINQTPRHIAPGNRQAFLPSVAVAADGTIGVSYYDFRFNDARPGLPTDYWLVTCRPTRRAPATNPASWGDEVRLTNNSFDMENTFDYYGAYFLGDYTQLTASGRDFLAVWSQPRGRNDPDSTFFRRVGPREK